MTALLATAVGGFLFYSHSKTFWSKDLETPFSSSAYAIICIVLTVLVFGIAFICSKRVVRVFGIPSWVTFVATAALGTPGLNLITGYLFARLNRVNNVYGFPLNSPRDLFADQVLLFIAGGVFGFGILLISLLSSWIIGKSFLGTQTPKS
ncbi:MAG: hypothetical protein IPM21_14985 [Acidobacteria bacterium]|nr:hypothetical protein [Acidobacteriota bacterium]